MYLSDHSKTLISAEEKVAEMRRQRDKLDVQFAAERNKLRAEVERLRFAMSKSCDDEREMSISEGPSHSTCGLAEELTARAERAEAELKAEREKVQTLERENAALRNDFKLLKNQIKDYWWPT